MLGGVAVVKADLEDHSNELKMAEDNAKKAMADAAKLSEELRHEQDHSSSIEKLRRQLESQVKELQVRLSPVSRVRSPGQRTGWFSLPPRDHDYFSSRQVERAFTERLVFMKGIRAVARDLFSGEAIFGLSSP